MKETLFSLAIESLDQCVDALMDGISAMMLSTDGHTTTVKTLLNRILQNESHFICSFQLNGSISAIVALTLERQTDDLL